MNKNYKPTLEMTGNVQPDNISIHLKIWDKIMNELITKKCQVY